MPALADPNVRITSPENGDVIIGDVRLDVEAPDAERIDYYVNGVRVAYDSTASDFSETWDSRKALDGEYQIVARVDGDELSDPVTFVIDNEPGEQPTEPAPTTESTPTTTEPAPTTEPTPTTTEPAPTTTEPAPTTEPTPVEPVGFPECDETTASNVVHPDGPGQYRPDSSTFQQQTVMDAWGSTWTRESAGDYPVIFKDRDYPAGGTVCWLGGEITSSEDMAASWDEVWHHTVGFYTDHPYTTVVGLRMDNQGDCIGIKDPGDDSLTRIHGVALTNCHDDVIENDLMKNVEVTDSVLEGYVLFAFRGGSAGAEDGRNNVWRIDDVVAWSKPQEAVYKGPVPGTGPMFKRPNNDSEEGWEPWFVITDSVFRVDMVPNHGDLSIPPGEYKNNIIVWTGDGEYPGEVPPGFMVTTDLSEWSEPRNAWYATH